MKELWEQATQVYNLPLTVGLIFFCAYWVISSIGIFDFDTDVDVDLDLDADSDVSIDGGIFSSILNFVNAAEVPVMLILTVLNAFMWAISMSVNEHWNPEGNLGIASLFFVLSFIVSIFLTKYLTKPIAPLFNSIKNDVEAATPLVGQVGKVKSRVLDHNYGQIIVERDKNAPALLSCKLSETDNALVRGDEVIVVKYEKESKRYIVRSLSIQLEKVKADQAQNEEEPQDDEQSETNHLTTNE